MSCRSGRLKNQHQKRPPSHAERASTAGWARPARNGRWPTGPSSGSFPGAPDCLQFPRSDGATGSSSGGRARRANRYFSQLVYGFRLFYVRNPSKSLQRKCGTRQFWRFENEFQHFENEFQHFENKFHYF